MFIFLALQDLSQSDKLINFWFGVLRIAVYGLGVWQNACLASSGSGFHPRHCNSRITVFLLIL